MKTKEQSISHLKDNSEITFEQMTGMSEIDFLTEIEEAFNEPEAVTPFVEPVKDKVTMPTFKDEVFHQILNYPNYQISNLGRVKSFSGVEKILKPQKHNRGYHHVTLFTNGKKNTFLIHQLMGIVFYGVKSVRGKTTIDHKNGIKTDNRLINLQVLSHRKNISKGYQGKKTSSKFTGVGKVANGTFVARIMMDGTQKSLGTFEKAEDAAKSYRKALLKNRVQTILQSA